MQDVIIPTLILITPLTISGLIGMAIANSKGRGRDGFGYGFLLGPIGWYIAFRLSDNRRQCKMCMGYVPMEAKKCMHCAEFLSGGRPSNPQYHQRTR